MNFANKEIFQQQRNFYNTALKNIGYKNATINYGNNSTNRNKNRKRNKSFGILLRSTKL